MAGFSRSAIWGTRLSHGTATPKTFILSIAMKSANGSERGPPNPRSLAAGRSARLKITTRSSAASTLRFQQGPGLKISLKGDGRHEHRPLRGPFPKWARSSASTAFVTERRSGPAALGETPHPFPRFAPAPSRRTSLVQSAGGVASAGRGAPAPPPRPPPAA